MLQEICFENLMEMGMKIVIAKWKWERWELKTSVSAVRWRCALYNFSSCFRSCRPLPSQ